ncbi:MAG: N-acetylmuramic acid 6-phosphate etherase [Candidatus Marinimicrobia bacterium]|nr:N-acetylmuramic acid 6-phosphate etherase [Candidatus Neomarinimicrobiota bacterium]
MKKINKITEDSNSKSKNIDKKNINEILHIINDEDRLVAGSVKDAISDVSAFIEQTVESLNNSGRLIYIGSGTSGRLGVLDASECPPTFGVSKNMVIGVIAGGDIALKESLEGAEDSSMSSIKQLDEISLNSKDIVLGISASGTTPFVISALKYAKKIGASTGLLTCNHVDRKRYVNHLIKVIVGPEILSGSTRLKSGTATKMVLNMISTVTMIKLNRTFGNVMIDLLPKNKKLINRSIDIIVAQLSIDRQKAKSIYDMSGGNLKIAILMGKDNLSQKEARIILDENKGSLSDSLKSR